eukprot:TRINITY_DN146_c0_g1_i7.p1 TRINITY_DN146_c0_g1~~TRINITY_DN146_c0_g1_i7.p1  ORF type:complete len:126 (-),score=50.90 TRINITY_DN146_c0_g1_i7:184-561(-)
MDHALLIFVLSAIIPTNMQNVFSTIYQSLKPGGYLFFRDYCEDDLAQQRFENSQGQKKLDEKFYVRVSGTLAYYFSLDEIRTFANTVGFEIVQLEQVCKQVENKKLEIIMQRKFIQAKLRKPIIN